MWKKNNNIVNHTITRPCVNFKKLISNNSFREKLYPNPSHLKTFKFKLFNKINKKDLMYNEEYIKVATDIAMMFPMLEMSKNKFKCINKPLYIYTNDHPNSLHQTKKQKQKQMDNIIRKRKKYKNVF